MQGPIDQHCPELKLFMGSVKKSAYWMNSKRVVLLGEVLRCLPLEIMNRKVSLLDCFNFSLNSFSESTLMKKWSALMVFFWESWSCYDPNLLRVCSASFLAVL